MDLHEHSTVANFIDDGLLFGELPCGVCMQMSQLQSDVAINQVRSAKLGGDPYV